jgi:membrane associated rhomboid family serine protease
MVTIILIIITVAVSLLAFRDEELFSKLKFNAYMVYHRKQYYRLLTHGFVHADFWHLFINMFVLYSFGRYAESVFAMLADNGIIKFAPLIYLLMYLAAIPFASSISLFRYKEQHWYNSVGASGAVSAVLFFCIFFDPWMRLQVYFMIPVPGIIFAGLYLIYSQYMSKRGGDNVNHDAHFLGALFGFIFPLILKADLIKFFIDSLLSYHR